jgi:hypothetical protein
MSQIKWAVTVFGSNNTVIDYHYDRLQGQDEVNTNNL